ncbi:MAG: FliM/FliN family flagellar motor switch protein [Pseudomonadota bacterium]
MTADTEASILRKMVRNRREAARPDRATLGQAWRAQLPRSADAGLGLVAALSSFEEGRTSRESLLGGLGNCDLMLSFEASSGRGLAVLDPELVTGLIEVQTTGMVTSTPKDSRPPTGTDAALTADVLNRWLVDVEGLYTDRGGDTPLRGYRLGRKIADTRAAMLSLDDGGFIVQRLVIDLGAAGERTGTLTLAYPADAVRAAIRSASAGPERGMVEAAEVELRGVLMRLRMPLDELRALGPGDILPFEPEQLGAVRVETADGRAVAKARLGQKGGHRALKLVAEETKGPEPQAAPQGDWAAAAAPGAPGSGDLALPGKVSPPELDGHPDPEVEPLATTAAPDDPIIDTMPALAPDADGTVP